MANDNVSAILGMKGGSGGGGGASDAVRYTAQTLTDEQKTQARNNIGGAASSSVSTLSTVVQGLVTYNVTVSGATPTITPAANTIYKCGELSSLTISNPPATGAYSIVFTSGSTPTAVIIPPAPAMRWQTDDNEPPQGFPAANTRYEINVEDSYVVLGEWPAPEVSA